jgi:putative transposase
VVINIKSKQYYLWRAVDKEGQVLDILTQSRRNESAAEKFFRKLLKATSKNRFVDGSNP